MTKIEVTHAAYQSLSIITRYMKEFIGLEQAISLAEQLINVTTLKLTENPQQCPVCHELELLGVTDYKQLTIDKYKILYRYDDRLNIVYVTAFMRYKQSAQQLLIAQSLLLE